MEGVTQITVAAHTSRMDASVIRFARASLHLFWVKTAALSCENRCELVCATLFGLSDHLRPRYCRHDRHLEHAVQAQLLCCALIVTNVLCILRVALNLRSYSRGLKIDMFSCGPKRFEVVADKVAERLAALKRGEILQPPPEPETPEDQCTTLDT